MSNDTSPVIGKIDFDFGAFCIFRTFWAPVNERSILMSIYIAGASFGSVVVFPLAGVLADAVGWRSIFYVTGASSLIWCIAWQFLVYDTPSKHPRISGENRKTQAVSLYQVFESRKG